MWQNSSPQRKQRRSTLLGVAFWHWNVHFLGCWFGECVIPSCFLLNVTAKFEDGMNWMIKKFSPYWAIKK
jgi:hypothetical protein